MIPRTQYARSGKVDIAYQVTGEGPLGSGLRFQDRGAHVLKGVPGEWRLYSAS